MKLVFTLKKNTRKLVQTPPMTSIGIKGIYEGIKETKYEYIIDKINASTL